MITLEELESSWDGVPFEKHWFLKKYDQEFEKYREKENLRILELGVAEGGSLQLWRRYFKDIGLLVGVDNDPDRNLVMIEHPIKFEVGDLTDKEFYPRLKRYGSFDIIIDDASHKQSDIMTSFNELFPLVSEDGIYCIENVGLNNNLDKFVYNLIMHTNGITDCLDYPERMNYYSWWIRSVHFENQLLIIRKGLWKHEQRHHQVG